jgi:hypothetical protein
MADNLTLNSGSGGSTLATDEDASGYHYQKVKLTDGTADSTTVIAAGNGVAAGALRVTMASDSTGQVKLAAGSASVGTVILGAGSAAVGTVALGAGTAAVGTVKAQGTTAHDAAGTSISPILTGQIAVAVDGTAPGTAVSENDLAYNRCDLSGIALVNQTHPYLFNAHVAYAASAQTNATVKAAVAAVSIWITDVVITNGPSAVNYVKLLDGSGGAIKCSAYMAVNSSVAMSFRNPLKLTSATLLAVTSTGNSELDITVTGYHAA